MSNSRLRTCSSGTDTREDDEDGLSFYIIYHGVENTVGPMAATTTGPAATLTTTTSNLRPEHFLEVIILLDVRCLLFPSISILSKRHPTKVMGFATLQLQNKIRTLKTLRLRENQNSIT